MNYIKTLSGYLLLLFSLLLSSCERVAKNQEGRIVKTIHIYNQEWTAENLNVNHFRNGDSIPGARSPEEWVKAGESGKPAWCMIQNDPEMGKKFGKLYNWFAVNDPRGLAPEGWHIASDDEWEKLINYFGGGVMAALRLKVESVGLAGKKDKVNRIHFDGLPGGCRNNRGGFYGADSFGYWWSATEVNKEDSWSRVINFVRCDINSLHFSKYYGLSVRCVRD
jgi:uncharacterized protein (TIGR02145 family)